MVESNFGVVDISFNFVVIIIANLDRSEKFNERQTTLDGVWAEDFDVGGQVEPVDLEQEF